MASSVLDFLVTNEILPSDARPDLKGNYRVPCIDECHERGSSSRNLSINGVTGGFQCFRCGYRGSFRKLQKRFQPPTIQEQILYAAQALFLDNLRHVESTLEARGFSHDVLWQHGIGYAPLGYSDTLLAKGFSQEDIVSSGLLQKFEDTGKIREKLADRITIPYYHSDGELYNWKARLPMDEAPDKDAGRPKYTALSGVHFSGPWNERALYREGELFICEGELDALTLTMHGYNAVALPGANFDVSAFKDLSPTLIYDADEAGRKAMRKAVKDIPDCRVVMLPEDYDINALVSELGIGAFRELVKIATPYVEGNAEESDNLAHRLEKYDNWAYANGALVGAETGFPLLTKAIDGWQSGLYVLPAGSNIGKSSFMLQCADQAIEHNSDTIVSTMSLDDSETVTFTKMLAYKADISYLQAMKPRHELLNKNDPSRNNPEAFERRKAALERLSALADRYIVRDIKWGRTVTIFERFIKKLRRQHQSKRILIFLDSFDKMLLGEGSLSNIEAKSALIQEVKRITVEQDVVIVTSSEIRKPRVDGDRPTNADIKDTTQVEYEADVVMLGFQEMHHDPETEMSWRSQENGQSYPIFELNLSKNKKSFFKGQLLYRFRTDKSKFMELTEDESQRYIGVLARQRAMKKERGGRKAA